MRQFDTEKSISTGPDKSHCPTPGASGFSNRASENLVGTCPWASDFLGQKKKYVCFRLPDLPYFFAPDPKLFFDHFEKSSGNRHVFPNRFFRVGNQNGRTSTASLPKFK